MEEVLRLGTTSTAQGAFDTRWAPTLQDSMSGHLYTRAYKSYRPQRHVLGGSQASPMLEHISHIIARDNMMSSCPGAGLSFVPIRHMSLAVRE